MFLILSIFHTHPKNLNYATLIQKRKTWVITKAWENCISGRLFYASENNVYIPEEELPTTFYFAAIYVVEIKLSPTTKSSGIQIFKHESSAP